MRWRHGATILVTAVGLGGAVAFGGCGSSSGATTNDTTMEAKSHEEQAMKQEDKGMKKEDSMKHEGDSMKHEGSSSGHMEG